MKYPRAYLRAFLDAVRWLAIAFFLITILFYNDLLAAYFIYVALIAGFAGPINILLNQEK